LFPNGWLKSERRTTGFDESCFHALSRIATAIISRRAKLYSDTALLTDMAVTLVGNDYGSEVIGHAIEPFFQRGSVAGRIPAIAAARKAHRDERQGRVGFRQEYDAAAAARTGGTT